ncbi:TetR/AcrR family transcriptional regulator [Streptomyces niveus]|uniref:TetR/AcrR family transcriptional regulator n=1 Tax=Streptomyces niveus TaxID=193462 RepID=UPI003637BD8F
MSNPKPVDPRPRRSRLALQSALRSLLSDRELAEITVSDITKQAGTSRSTFYDHYTDVHKLAADACTEQFDELLAATPVSAHRPAREDPAPENPLLDLFTHVEANARLYGALLGPDGSARVINHLHHRITIAFFVNVPDPAGSVRTHAGDPVEIPLDPASAFYAGALIGVVLEWLRCGRPQSPATMAAATWPLVLDARQRDDAGAP